MIVVAVENGINTFPVAMLQVLALAAIWTQHRLRIFVCRHYCDELDLNHARVLLLSENMNTGAWLSGQVDTRSTLEWLLLCEKLSLMSPKYVIIGWLIRNLAGWLICVLYLVIIGKSY